MKAVKLCRDCGRPIKNATNFRVVCDDCLRKKEKQGGMQSALWKMKMLPGGAPSRASRKSPSRAWNSVCAKPPPWASATASMWPGGWINRERGGERKPMEWKEIPRSPYPDGDD